jgi:undecaprenyl-diphosphatase
LAFQRLKLRELLAVELAASCINRLVPSGLGGLGFHGLYLHKRRHTVAQATAVVSINNLLGVSVHLLLLALVLLTGSAGQFRLGWSLKQGWVLLGICLLLGSALLLGRVRRTVRSFVRNLLVSLRRYERQPHRLAYAALALCALTLTNVLVLHLAARSFGVWLELPQLFLVYTGGVLVGAAVPTPGGLAGVEAGLVAGFMAYGVGSTTAIAIALAFRLSTYWLPILPGAVSLVLSRRLRLI